MREAKTAKAILFERMKNEMKNVSLFSLLMTYHFKRYYNTINKTVRIEGKLFKNQSFFTLDFLCQIWLIAAPIIKNMRE